MRDSHTSEFESVVSLSSVCWEPIFLSLDRLCIRTLTTLAQSSRALAGSPHDAHGEQGKPERTPRWILARTPMNGQRAFFSGRMVAILIGIALSPCGFPWADRQALELVEPTFLE